MENLSELYMENTAWFDWMLGVGRSLDMVSRDYIIGEKRARLWVVDGYGKDETLERMGAFWLTLKPEQMEDLADMQAFADRFISFSETRVSFDRDDIVTSVLLGQTLVLIDGLRGAALIDCK